MENQHKKKNRRPKFKLLNRVFHALHTILKRKPTNTAHVVTKEIYEEAEIPSRTYKENFGDVDDVIQYANEEFIDVFDLYSGKVPSQKPNLAGVFRVLLSRLRGHEEAVNIVIDRFDNNVMREAIERIKPIITFGWENRYTMNSRRRMLEEYTDWFFWILREWVETGMPVETVEEHARKLSRLHEHVEAGGKNLGGI